MSSDVRDSKHPDDAVLSFGSDSWVAFLDSAAAGLISFRGSRWARQ